VNFAVLGSNTSQSLSPRLHSFIYRLINLEHSYSYIESSKIDFSVLSNYDGLNITNPFKNNIIKYMDQLDPIALKTQSVNCIKIINKVKYGYNTDYYGFSKSIKLNNINFSNREILVIGAGGVSNTICRYLVDKKFNFKIINRTGKHLEILLKRLNLGENNIAQYSPTDSLKYDTIINCTSSEINMENYFNSINLDYNYIDTYIDVNYNLKNNFIKNIKTHKIIDGLDMLIFQAIKSIEIWIENDILQSVDYKKIKNHIIKNKC